MRHLVAFNIKTTGLDTSNDSILQITAVKFNMDFKRIDSYFCYVIPSKEFEISEGAFKKHGPTKELIVEEGFPSADVMRSFHDFCEDCDMLSYNGNSFGIEFLTREMHEAGRNVYLAWIKLLYFMSVATAIPRECCSFVKTFPYLCRVAWFSSLDITYL